MKSSPVRPGLGVFVALLVFSSPARAQFVDQTNGILGSTATSFGVAWGDCDKDGDFDLFFTNGSGQSKMLRNEGAGSFSDVTVPPLGGKGADIGALWFDVDGDRDLDLFVTNANYPNRLLRNDDGVFVEIPAGDAAGSNLAQSVAAADYDKDGDLDLYISYWGSTNKLLRNDGGMFFDVTPPALAINSKSSGVAWADYDNDGDPDLYVGGHVLGRLIRNDGSGAFTDVTSGVLGKSGVNGVAWADYDNDGDLDLYLARDLNSSRLLRNDSTPGIVNFTDMFVPAVRDPGAGQGMTWLDYDNDGDLDIFLVKAGSNNGSGGANRLVRNNGGDSFTEVSSGPVLAVANSRGVATADYDGNGFPDLYIANWGSSNQLLKNIQPAGPKWIHVGLQGVTSNTMGIGARVRVKSGGKWQMREMACGSGIYGMDAPVAMFGLTSSASIVDSIQVLWPSGVVTDSVNVGINKRITLWEETQTGVPGEDRPQVARLLAAFPNPFRAGTTIAYDLSEPSPVRIFIVDASGRLLRVLESTDRKEPGRYTVPWDGRAEDGRQVAQGVYFYSLQAESYRRSLPIVLVR